MQKNIMGEIKVINTDIDGLYVIEPEVDFDDRVSSTVTYNREIFFRHGLESKFVQDNEVVSKKGVLRGMHVNIKHPQSKLIRVIDGEILDVVIDLRKKSKTYMSCVSMILSDMNKKQLYIPEGMGHGYLAKKDSKILFKTTTHYIPEDEIGFAWNSKAMTIDWSVDIPILNERDRFNKDLFEVWK